MIYLLHILVTANLLTAAATGAIHSKLPRRVPYLSFFYFGWSLIGQIFALPIALLSLASLYFAMSTPEKFVGIAIINVITIVLCTLTLWRAWQGSQALTKILPDGSRTSIKRYLIGGLFPFQFARRDVKRLSNIAYGPSGRKHTLDIYKSKAESNSPLPVLILVHGGGWVVGHKNQQAKPLIQYMASRGWLVVDINYRLAPRNKMPVMIQDVLRAVAWVKANIETYNGDPNFVAMTGGSAGGHLAALAGLASHIAALKPGFETADCSLDACVPVYGVYDFLNKSGAMQGGAEELQNFLTRLVMPGPPERHEDVWNLASPINHIRPDAPPMLFLHGHHDAIADFESAKAFAKSLEQVSNNRVIFAELPSAQHAYDIAYSPPTPEHVRAVYRFLESVRLDMENDSSKTP